MDYTSGRWQHQRSRWLGRLSFFIYFSYTCHLAPPCGRRPVAHRGVVHGRVEDGRGGPGALVLTRTRLPTSTLSLVHTHAPSSASIPLGPYSTLLHTLSLSLSGSHSAAVVAVQAKQAGVRSIDVLRSATLAHDAVPPSPSPPPPSPASSPHVVAKRVTPQLLGTGGVQATSLLKLKLKKVAAAKAADKGETFVETLTVRLERGPQGFGMVLNGSNRLTSLVPGGPAAQSQLMEWDRITKVDGLELTGQLGAMAKSKDAMVLTVERPPERCHDDIIAREAAGNQTPFGSDPLLEKSLPPTPTLRFSSRQLQLDDQPSPPIGGYNQTLLLATQDGAAESIEVLSELLLHNCGTQPELRLPALQALYLALSDAEWAEEELLCPPEEEETPSLHSSSWASSSSSRGRLSSSPYSSPSSALPPPAAHAGDGAMAMLARTEAEENARREVEMVGIKSILSRADATAGAFTAATIASSASIASIALRPSLSPFTAPLPRFLVFPSSSPSSPSFSSPSSLQALELPSPLRLSASAKTGALEAEAEAEAESEAEVEAEVGAPIDPSVAKLLARRDEQAY